MKLSQYNQMKFSDENRKTLMIHLHQTIEHQALSVTDNLLNREYSRLAVYPPNGGLTSSEIEALEVIKGNESLRSALRKVLADNSAFVLFDLFNMIDGTGDPDPAIGEWSEVVIIDRPEDYIEDHEMLHDEFFSTYEDWKAMRPDTDWSPDNL
jgi:hypothetical protein